MGRKRNLEEAGPWRRGTMRKENLGEKRRTLERKRNLEKEEEHWGMGTLRKNPLPSKDSPS